MAGTQRKTQQREVIRDVLTESGRPLSPVEVLDLAAERIPGIGQATVYRALKQFVDDGWLQTVELPGEPPRYELTGKGHHHHFSCRLCGGVFDIAGCSFQLSHPLPRGFRMESHEVVIYGICADCHAQKQWDNA